MNTTNLDKVVQAYIDNFDYVNGDEHQEYYKWEAFKHFKDNWDIDAENFVEMFKESVKLTYNLIDNKAVSPTNGIVKLAERSELTEVIRKCLECCLLLMTAILYNVRNGLKISEIG